MLFIARCLTALTIMFLSLCLPMATKANAASFDVSEVQVSVQAEDAVKARDQAIAKAQRIAFGILVGQNEENLKRITDAQIARLVSGFSVKDERLTARAYSANFTIRFEPNRTQMFIQSQQFDLVPQQLESMSSDTVLLQANAPVENSTILVLPVLDIGTRRIVWDDPNPWRGVWQEKDYSVSGMPVRVPMGDVNDIADIPDAQFLSGGRANIQNLLSRYSAGTLYIAVVKSQGAALNPSGGMALSLYRHDGKNLQFIKKMTISPRPGYAFNDAVPAALNMIVLAENNKEDEAESVAAAIAEEQQDHSARSLSDDLDAQQIVGSEQKAIMGMQKPNTAQGRLVVTIPYQNLPQWVSIQRRLRGVQGVQNIVPIRVSPSSAEVQIVTSETTSRLSDNMKASGFTLQALPDGDIALIEQ